MKIIYIGDIVARPGRDVVKKLLPELLQLESPDFVVANAENLAHGRGATEDTIKEMQSAGIDYFTSGDHIFWYKGFDDVIDNLPVVRPANLPGDHPGKPFADVDLGQKGRVLLLNFLGRSFMNDRLDDPFRKADDILSKIHREDYSAILVDFHAEATTEKYTFGYYLDGRVDAVVGTHTHVPTCDERIMPKGTLFVTDIGMSGVVDSALGVKSNIILDHYLTGLNQKFEWEEKGRVSFRSVVIDTKKKTIKRFDKNFF